MAVASKYLAVGGAVPPGGRHRRARHAVVRQRRLPPAGSRAAAGGLSAPEVVDALRPPTTAGRTASSGWWTPRAVGDLHRRGVHGLGRRPAAPVTRSRAISCTGPEVAEAMEQAWLSFTDPGGAPTLALARRLLAALAAGDAAGGDRGPAERRARSGRARGRDRRGPGPRGGCRHPRRPPGRRPRGTGRGADPAPGARRLYFGKPDPATLLPLRGSSPTRSTGAWGPPATTRWRAGPAPRTTRNGSSRARSTRSCWRNCARRRAVAG